MNTTSPNADAGLDRIPSMAYARLLTRTYSKSFYLATQFMPAAKREDVYAVYAFCRYTDNIVDSPRQRDRQLLKRELDQWREELSQAWRSGESQHPVLCVFIPVLHKYNIPLQLPLELIDGVEMDLTHDRYEQFTQLRTFCYHVASVVGLMMTYIFGYRDRSAFVFAEALGIAMQLTNILRDISEDWQLRRKVYVPLTEMEEYGVSIEDIAAGRMSPDMRSFLKAQVDRAHSYFEYAEQGIPLLQPQGQAAVRAAASLYREILREIERADYNVFAQRPVVSTTRKLRTLGRMVASSWLPSRPGKTSTVTPQAGFSGIAKSTLPPLSSLE
ncbi:MAG: phytoene/squalene synthase family protein [Bacteroidetes bacterium]|nr:phytoene/squalene synthase family protein [Bacteroidota bacterium]